jgi:hypothetical protein
MRGVVACSEYSSRVRLRNVGRCCGRRFNFLYIVCDGLLLSIDAYHLSQSDDTIIAHLPGSPGLSVNTRRNNEMSSSILLMEVCRLKASESHKAYFAEYIQVFVFSDGLSDVMRNIECYASEE